MKQFLLLVYVKNQHNGSRRHVHLFETLRTGICWQKLFSVVPIFEYILCKRSQKICLMVARILMQKNCFYSSTLRFCWFSAKWHHHMEVSSMTLWLLFWVLFWDRLPFFLKDTNRDEISFQPGMKYFSLVSLYFTSWPSSYLLDTKSFLIIIYRRFLFFYYYTKANLLLRWRISGVAVWKATEFGSVISKVARHVSNSIFVIKTVITKIYSFSNSLEDKFSFNFYSFYFSFFLLRSFTEIFSIFFFIQSQLF